MIKYKDIANFYINKFGEYKKIYKGLNEKVNAILFYTDYESNKRMKLVFNFDKIQKQDVSALIKLAKFLQIPQIFKDNYSDLCKFSMFKNDLDEEDINFSLQKQETICILMLKPQINEKMEQIIYKIQQFQLLQIQQMAKNIQSRQDLFENFHTFQFGFLDIDYHYKLKTLFQNITQEKQEFNITKQQNYAMAIFGENNKAAFLQFLGRMEDWFDDLMDCIIPIYIIFILQILESSTIEYVYLSKYLNNEDIYQLLKYSNSHQQQNYIDYIEQYLKKFNRSFNIPHNSCNIYRGNLLFQIEFTFLLSYWNSFYGSYHLCWHKNFNFYIL